MEEIPLSTFTAMPVRNVWHGGIVISFVAVVIVTDLGICQGDEGGGLRVWETFAFKEDFQYRYLGRDFQRHLGDWGSKLKFPKLPKGFGCLIPIQRGLA